MPKKTNNFNLPLNTMVEVVALCKGKKPIRKEMTLKEWSELKKKQGWNYSAYQIGRYNSL
tara:strand:- start:44 stop:223 length:180 start_codon:yes stop_codon:yes gene_type:complete